MIYFAQIDPTATVASAVLGFGSAQDSYVLPEIGFVTMTVDQWAARSTDSWYDPTAKTFIVPPPPVPLPPPTDAQLIVAALATLASLRYSKEIAGINFQASGATAKSLFATDRDSQAKISSAYVMASAGKWVDGTPWKASDGGFVTMAAADIEALGVQAAAYVAGCYAVEASYAAQIQTNPAVDTSTGWPSQG
jgi:hypothetical protein